MGRTDQMNTALKSYHKCKNRKQAEVILEIYDILSRCRTDQEREIVADRIYPRYRVARRKNGLSEAAKTSGVGQL